MNKLEILTLKNSLVESETYKQIRELQLKQIIELSDSGIEPTLLKGMLKTIHDTDKWAENFLREKRKDVK